MAVGGHNGSDISALVVRLLHEAPDLRQMLAPLHAADPRSLRGSTTDRVEELRLPAHQQRSADSATVVAWDVVI